MNEFLIHLLWKLPVAFIGFSVGEWAIHKYLLHGRWVYNHIPMLRYIYEHHTIEHHAEGQNETYPHINLSLIDYWFAWLLVTVGLTRYFYFGYIDGLAGAVACIVVAISHMLLWNTLHHDIHELGKPGWITKMPGYSAFKSHHLGHHDHVNRNYGVVFIWIDRVMGTKTKRQTI